MTTLDPRDRHLLDLAAAHLTGPSDGTFEAHARHDLDLTATRAYQALNALIDDPAAWEHDPALMARLDRRRTRHTR